MYLNQGDTLNSLYKDASLTLTWDVFKLLPICSYFGFGLSLTLTWDVFKLDICKY